ncbi:MAG: DUF421 domain-containing protein [Alphaproteobacteria bacterium]|nr:MAG: DUF421 domain-containing protein [Alphaproteobacteria bacterium]
MEFPVFFDGWEGLARILIVAPIAYVALVAFLRVSGKRTLTKLNAFDLVITVALGSTLSTQILSKDTPLLEGVLAVATLISLQWIVTFTSVRSARFRHIVRAKTTVLLKDGQLRKHAMRRERITEGEILQAARTEGVEELNQALVVYLQSDGSLAAILK